MVHPYAVREAQLSSYAIQANATQRDTLLKKLQSEVQASVSYNEQLLRDRIAATVIEFEGGQEKKGKSGREDGTTAPAATAAGATTIRAFAEKQKPVDPKDKDKAKNKDKDKAKDKVKVKDDTTRLLKDSHHQLSGK